MKKVLTAMLMLLGCTLLSGCMDLNVELGVAEHKAAIHYRVELDLKEYGHDFRDSAKSMLMRLKYSYASKDFEATLDYPEDLSAMVLDLRLEVERESDAEAFLALKELLYDEKISPFMALDMSGVETGVEQAYRFSGTVDIGRVIEAGAAGDLPDDIQNMIKEGLEGCTGTLTIRLPASEVLSGNAEVTGGTAAVTVPLRFDDETAAELSTRYYAGGRVEDDIASLQSRQRVLYAACGVTAALLILMVILAMRRKAKKPEEAEVSMAN